MPVRLTLAVLLLTAALAPADDWPQWMGPNRDNVWREDGIVEKFPDGGPKVLWRTPVAGGYAGPAVAGGKVYGADYTSATDLGEGNFNRKEANGTERVFALDAATGKQLWEHKYPVRYTISYPTGPRCTPTVHGGKAYFLGAEGNLLCCDAESGKIAWQKDLRTDYKTKSALWGYAAHPLIDGKKLITLAGSEGSHVVALDKDTGAEIWRSQSQPEQGYVPPSIIEAGGVRQLIVGGPKAVRSLDPETGKRYWTVPYDATSGSIIMTPVRSNEFLFIGGYEGKTLLMKLASDKPAAEVVWQDKRRHGISPINVQPMVVDGVIYGLDESGEMFAVELPSGKRLWTSDAPLVAEKKLPSGTAFVYRNGDRFFLFNDLGEVVICKLNPKGYEEVSRAKVIEPTGKAFGRTVVWCAPAFAGKKMFVRNDKEMICVDLAQSK
ncbi:MAG TPA: PQQ-binding-like beta-propeller repeat protein [Fimbriiglobus sp.]|nr:PQQ-binding-like beta-propeller repeat protein [Fimbriiglobus sp.]